jgi:hypothetical protein
LVLVVVEVPAVAVLLLWWQLPVLLLDEDDNGDAAVAGGGGCCCDDDGDDDMGMRMKLTKTREEDNGRDGWIFWLERDAVERAGMSSRAQF